MKLVLSVLAAFMILPAWMVAADEPSNYTMVELLSPCVEADNDARGGAAAEIECEQYLEGFTDALAITGQLGKSHGICLPAQSAERVDQCLEDSKRFPISAKSLHGRSRPICGQHENRQFTS